MKSASVKRGSEAVADNEERPRLRLRAERKRGQQPLPDLEEEVTSTVLVESGSAPTQGGSSSSADVPVDSSVATSVSVEDMVQTSVPFSTSVGTQPASAGTTGTLCFNESKPKDFEKLTNLVLTSKAYPGRPSSESVQRLVKTCVGMSLNSTRHLSSTNVQCSLP